MTDFLSGTGIGKQAGRSKALLSNLLQDTRESLCVMELERMIMHEFKKENMPGDHYLLLIEVAIYCGLEQLAIRMKENLEKNLNKFITKI